MRAEALPGVVAVVTGADAARLPDPYYGVGIRDQPVVAIERCAMSATWSPPWRHDEETAYRALALIDVNTRSCRQ